MKTQRQTAVGRRHLISGRVLFGLMSGFVGYAVHGYAVAADSMADDKLTLEAKQKPPISIIRQGTFNAGGKVIGNDEKSLHCDHGVVEYQIPANARKTSLFMWHSTATFEWTNRWDGGEGFQSMFLRQRYPVYLWDGPAVGRANWGCDGYTYQPDLAVDQKNWIAFWRWGPSYGTYFPGVQVPQNDKEAWNQATRSRYFEFDSNAHAHLEADAAAAAIDRIGPTVAVTNSAAGYRALIARMKSDNVKGIYMYEGVPTIYPEGEAPTDFSTNARYKADVVSAAEFRKLVSIPIMNVYGDNTANSFWQGYVETSKKWAEIANRYGGKASVVVLPELGIRGNTHMPMTDMNNEKIAELFSAWLHENKLDEN